MLLVKPRTYFERAKVNYIVTTNGTMFTVSKFQGETQLWCSTQASFGFLSLFDASLVHRLITVLSVASIVYVSLSTLICFRGNHMHL